MMHKTRLAPLALLLAPMIALAENPAPSGYGPNGPAQNTWQPDSTISKAIDAAPDAGKADTAINRLAAKQQAERQGVFDKTLAEHQTIIREFGLDPKKAGYLYFFESTSMPENLRYEYARDAMWTGGIVVFNGIDKDHDIPWFIKNVMGKLARKDAKSSPSISLDSRLFQTFGITAVPAIVYSTVNPQDICMEQHASSFVAKDGQTLPIHLCNAADPKTYWKITGSVKTQFALEQFAKDGAPEADKLVKIMAVASQGLKPGETMDAKTYQSAPGPDSIGSAMELMNAPSLNAPGLFPVKP